ncbi:hypothetical protein B0T22DRAFT_441342 [Podospora appendiculata]|uniref:Uncharacterized protein n=1 Tax=Podospora appendiculata TaxID=314037 RepID=A0AAE0XBY5_9PEZI|nr:hypothetical protein B0T22DRAFT_441342 [Podospora appendiculata]
MDRYVEYKLVPDARNDDEVEEALSELGQHDKAPGQHGRCSGLQWQGIRATKWFQIGFLVVAAVFVALSIGISCFFLGKHVQKRQMNNDFIAPTGSIPTVFTYNKEFSGPPTNHSKHIWMHSFPSKAILPANSSIWRAYWAAVEGTEPEHDAGVGHVRHCIDYLRQSLMCLADTNQEPMDEKLKASTGFGVTRMCRNYDKLTAFADEWRISDD